MKLILNAICYKSMKLLSSFKGTTLKKNIHLKGITKWEYECLKKNTMGISNKSDLRIKRVLKIPLT